MGGGSSLSSPGSSDFMSGHEMFPIRVLRLMFLGQTAGRQLHTGGKLYPQEVYSLSLFKVFQQKISLPH